MTNKSKTGLALLEETLEIYGADRTRWPLEVRRALSGLLSENADARRILAEGEALDRLLDLAPALDESRVIALSARIAAASRTTPRMASTANVQAPRPSVWTPRRAASGMALAASLALGIVAGQSVQMAPAVNELAAAVGIDASSEVASGNNTVALGDDAETGFDEDLL
jgi:hypothetical protein